MTYWQARFVPQAWINDYAVDVDPEGCTEWAISDDDAAAALPEAQQVCATSTTSVSAPAPPRGSGTGAALSTSS